MRFSQIKSNVNKTLLNYFLTKKDNYKGFSKDFFKLLRENKELKKLYKFYEDVNSMEFKNDSVALHFINENKKNINYNIKNELLNLFNKWDIKLNENSEINKIDLNLDLLFESKDEQYYYSQDLLVEHLKTKKEKIADEVNENLNVPPSVLVTLITNKFNEKYSDKLNESEKEILKSVIDGESKKLFENLKEKTLMLIEEKKSEFNSEIISEVETKLKGMVYSESTFVNDIIKINYLLEGF
jgi:hypothetical protein